MEIVALLSFADDIKTINEHMYIVTHTVDLIIVVAPSVPAPLAAIT